MTTIKQLKEGAQLPAPIYKEKPYIVLSKENAVLIAGTLEEIIGKGNKIVWSGYYDDCEVKVRGHDLHMNNNERIGDEAKRPDDILNAIAQEHPQVKELLEAYENCLEEIGDQRQTMDAMNQLMTSMQNTLNGFIQELEVLRPLYEIGQIMRSNQRNYYASRPKKKNIILTMEQQQIIHNYLVQSKINENKFDDLIERVKQFYLNLEKKQQIEKAIDDAQPDQPELL